MTRTRMSRRERGATRPRANKDQRGRSNGSSATAVGVAQSIAAALAPPVGIQSDTPQGSAPFEPTSAQVRYLLELEDALEQRRPVTDSAICKALKMSRLTLWEWKLAPRFRAWLRQKLDQTSDDHWPLILRRHELQAINGSVKSAEFIGRVRFMAAKLAAGLGGGTALDEPAGDITTNYNINVLVKQDPKLGTINLLVPRPPALDEVNP